MTHIPRILVVDDEEGIRLGLQEILRREGFVVHTAGDGQEALERLAEPVDVVLADLRMPRLDGLALLRALKSREPNPQVIMMSGFASIESAVEATKEGAFDYLPKPIKPDTLLPLIRRALEEQRARVETDLRRKDLSHNYQRPNLLGNSGPMRQLFRVIDDIAATDSTVLIQGESGTGKELVARTIHALSARNDRPFVAVNCGSVTESLLESELFGYVRGAFTGAVRDASGLFQAAQGGTLFLDEIGETAPGMQVKLLRALEEREVRPVGGVRDRKIDVRFLAATNSNLDEQVQTGGFRSDLFYRLNVIALTVPALRERREDIPLLVNHYLAVYSMLVRKEGRRVSPEAMTCLVNYAWPGNVRELKNAIERAVILSRSGQILPEDLPHQILGNKAGPVPPLSGTPTLAAIEKTLLLSALYETGWNQTEAASRLGISRTTIWRKIKEYQLEPPAPPPPDRVST
jgi:DNA-binding NtrC family response regulator